jgi:ABC-type Fe3+-hydroxamate transport system substrate-binding protein
MKHLKKELLSVLTMLLFFTLLTGCGASDTPTSNGQNNETIATNDENEEVSGEAVFPRTVTLNGEEITIQEKPQRITAISLDTTEVLVNLVDPERIAVVSQSIENEYLSHMVLNRMLLKCLKMRVFLLLLLIDGTLSNL